MTYTVISKPLRLSRAGKGRTFRHLLSLIRQRRALARLDDDALADIGITRNEARAESARPVWDAPENWCKQLY